MSGIGRVLRKERPNTKIILTEPANAQFLGSGHAQEREANNAPAVSHPAFEPRPIQGGTPDFVPAVLQEAIDGGYYDELIPVAGADGIKCAQDLERKGGVFTGISGGATFAVALAVAETTPEGSVILCMLPDTGERYPSTPLFEDIAEDMDAEEQAISMSTPDAQMD